MKHEFSTKEMSALLAHIQKGQTAPVYLLYGDEYLCKSASKKIVEALVPLDKQGLNCEMLDGATTAPEEIVGRINTFPLLPGPKVVAVGSSPFFYSQKNTGQILKKAKQAFEKQEVKKAARYFLEALAVAGISIDGLKDGDIKILDGVEKGLGSVDERGGWPGEVISYCLDNGLSGSHTEDGEAYLLGALQKGFPEKNHLILLAEMVDKRKKLYKAIKKTGIVIDCTISAGNKMADKRQQEAFFKSQVTEILQKAGKSATSGMFEALYEKTGPELRVFHHELEKLISFVGDRTHIGPKDVEQTTRKTRQDPIYELSNALAEKDLSKTLSLIQSLVESGMFPLQILSAMVTQIRKLLLTKDLARKIFHGRPTGKMEYRAFQYKVLPKIQQVEENPLAKGVHPYVLYKSLGQADNYSEGELVRAMETCLRADIQLKTSGQNSRFVLEKVVMEICKPS